MKMNPRKTRPRVKPTPFPKFVETLCQIMIATTMFTIGMNMSRTHQTGFPAICANTTRL